MYISLSPESHLPSPLQSVSGGPCHLTGTGKATGEVTNKVIQGSVLTCHATQLLASSWAERPCLHPAAPQPSSLYLFSP